MPIDQMMLGPMLDPFKTMADDCTAKGYSGKSYDQMMTALKRMEQLGQELDDFMEFSTKMTTENLQMDFSLAYGRVLSEGNNQQTNSADNYDDNALLKQTLDALKNAVVELKKGEEAAIAAARKHQTASALNLARAVTSNPYNIAIREAHSAAFDALASAAKFDIPNSLSLSLAFDKISQDYVSRISKWQATESAWERIFSLLDTWVMAKTRFAPHIEP
jgi:hypothetical protein